MNESPQERNKEDTHAERFFSVKQDDAEKKDSLDSKSLAGSADSEDGEKRGCVTLRIVQFLLPCLRRKGVWEPSQGDLFKSQDAEETKYPRTLRILENKIFDVIFVSSCLLSMYLFLFSEGFLIESRLLWGIIHLVNAVYAIGLFSQWLQVLIKSKYAKTNHGYTTWDIVYTLLSVFPADLIVLAIYTLNDDDDNENSSETNPIREWMITVSRLNYFLRIRTILQYLSKWEDQLVVGDFRMFMLRTFLFSTFLLHMFACIWHRIACDSFKIKHFSMTADEATVELCDSDPVVKTWIGLLFKDHKTPLLDHPKWHVLLTHYLVSVYWTIIAMFRLGASDIRTSLISEAEVAFVAVTEITAWIFVLAFVNGTLASLFIEKDTEKQNFITRCFAIRHYLHFGRITRNIQDDVTRFYNYLWEKSSGILNLDLVDAMPHAMKSEVFYDVNKFVLDQLPILKGLETPFLMSLSVRTNHRFYMSGEYLFRRNEIANAMYYLVKGHLEVLSEDEKHAITSIRSGSVIGEMHLLQPYPHVATVRCGSDCEIRMLSRKHFKQVLNIYPQYEEILEQRLEARLEQCGLLLALCEKHNTYHKAFKALTDFTIEHEIVGFQHSELAHSFENVAKVLTNDVYENINSTRDSNDFDGLSLKSEVEGLAQLKEVEREEKKNYEEMLAAAFEALEADVARAVSLANDLNIPRPPLIVSAPETSTRVTMFKNQADAGNIFASAFRRLKDTEKGKWYLTWKFLVALCVLAVFWFYPYQFAFRRKETVIVNHVFHLTGIIFLLDFIYDMIQIIITPQRTFESVREIAVYRLKSFYFWFRLFSIIPFEYIHYVIQSNAELTPYFYLWKMNRLFLIHLVLRFMKDLETKLQINPVMMIMSKFLLALFFVCHFFCVFYRFIQRDLNNADVGYRQTFYWAIVITTALGYGDFPAQTNAEVMIEVFGLIVGVSTLIYMQARVTAMLVNSERKRVNFKQTFYSLQTFMKQKRFPKSLWARVCSYYKLQWRVHEGTLIPTGRSAIWDAPKSLITKVAYAHAHKYVSKIPMFMHALPYIQNEICVALKHYVVPPGEILLYPDDLVRDLYIISKGYVEVVHEGVRVGVFTEGRYFGLNGLLFGQNNNFMYRTVTHCQLFCLTHESFNKIAYTNTNFVREVEIISGKRKSFHSMSIPSADHESDLLEYPPDTFLNERIQKGKPTHAGADAEEHSNTFMSRFQSCPRRLQKNIKDIFRNPYFLPHGKALRLWTMFRVMIAVFATIFAPAQAAFPIHPRSSLIVTLVFDVVAWIDIIISMRIAYFGSDYQLVTSSRKMITHYLKGPFLIDVLACFPADLIAYVILSQHQDFKNMYHLVSLFRLNRMLQIYKILLVNSMLEKAIARKLSLVMLLEMAPIMFLFLNLSTCLSVLRVCGVSRNGKPQKCYPDAWILKGLEQLDYSVQPGPQSNHLPNTFRAYIVGLYWVTQSVMSVGYGDIEIGVDYVNQIVATMVILFGILVVSYCGSKLTSCIIGEDPAKVELQEKMKLMNSYLEEQRAPRSIRKRVRETYLNSWDKTKGISPSTLFLSLPPTLRGDVMKQLYGSTLRMSQLFEQLDGPGIRMLASSLSEIFYPEGEFLMKFGDLCNDIFFIAQGAVVCYNVRGTIMSHMGGGSLIGEISPHFHTHRLYTTIAVKDVNAYVFKKDAFMNFLEQYPEIRHALEVASVKHYREAMKGSKKTDFGGESDVFLSIQNERKGDDASADAFPPTRSHDKSVNADGDPTRNVLQEDLLKNPEDFSKATNAKWWSAIVTFGRMARDDMGLVHVYQELGQCNIFNFAIHPASSACNWVSFCLALTALSCSITAYEIAFSGVEESVEKDGLIGFRDALEIFYIIRLVGNFHLGYYDETSALITDVKKITRRYLKRIDGFWLDAITTFPFYLINHIRGLETSYIRGIQLLRVCLFVRYLNETESRLKMKASRVKIIKITILLCFIFHFCACAWYLVACYDVYCTVGSWMDKTLNDLYVTGGIDPNQASIALRYLLSLYYVTNALTFTGFQDISPRTNIELVITIGMIIGTVFVIGYLVGEMAQCLASQVANKIHYQHKLLVLEVIHRYFMPRLRPILNRTMTYFYSSLQSINHFTILGISPAKIAEVRHHFKLLWCRCKGAMLFHLMEELPYSLRADVAMEIYGTNIKSSRILGKLDDNLIRQISARIHQEVYFPGSHIVRAGDVCTSMYFIKKGEVVILDGSSNLELCVEILYESECFGEVKILLPQEQYRFSYKARLETEVGVLHQDDLDAVLKNHPRIYDELKEKAGRIKVRRLSLKEDDESRINALHKTASSTSVKTLVHPPDQTKSSTNLKP